MRQLLLFTAMLFFFSHSRAQIGIRFYKDASYYPITGSVVNGKISWAPEQDYFMFKSDSNGEKQKIFLSETKSIIVKKDTLFSLYYFDGKHNKFYLGKLLMGGKTKLYSKLFSELEKYIDFGFNPTYNSQSPQSAHTSPFATTEKTRYSAASIYYFGTDTPQETIQLDKANFKEQMSNILADYPDIVDQIQSERLKLKNMDSILKEYKSRNGITPVK